MRRGFVYSMDALLAFFVTFFLLLLCFNQLNQINWSNQLSDESLTLFSQSAVSVGQKSGLFSRAIFDHQPVLIQSFLESFPATICAQVNVDEIGSTSYFLDLVVIKNGCSPPSKNVWSDRKMVSVIKNGSVSFYRVELLTWRDHA